MKKGFEILEEFLLKENINLNQLARKMGLTRTQPLYDIRSGKVKKISEDYADKIIFAFPGYQKKWLMTGEGEMLKEDMASSLQDQRINKDYEGVEAKELMAALHNFSEAAKLNAIANDKNADARLLEAQNTKELISLINEKQPFINKQAKTG